jgi:hypothetical protein
MGFKSIWVLIFTIDLALSANDTYIITLVLYINKVKNTSQISVPGQQHLLCTQAFGIMDFVIVGWSSSF